MPELFKKQWVSCGKNSIHCVVDDYVLELHNVGSLVSWSYIEGMGIKVLSGENFLRIDSGGKYSNEIRGDSGFEYESLHGEQIITLQTVSDTSLVMAVMPKQCKKFMNCGYDSSIVMQEFKPFYEEPSPVKPVVAPPNFKWRIGHDPAEKCVTVDFEHATYWMMLKPEEAEQAANRLLHHARKARGF